MLLELTQRVAAPRRSVWEMLTDWERQPEWMLDAEQVVVLTPQRTGVGVMIRCPTNLFGVRVQDVMRVNEWQAPRRLGVVHLGRIITGTGTFELTEESADVTRITWTEVITPPLGRVGEWGATVLVLPILRRIFARSFRNLAEVIEDDEGSRER